MPELIRGSLSFDDPSQPRLHAPTSSSPDRGAVSPDSATSPSSVGHLALGSARPHVDHHRHSSSFWPEGRDRMRHAEAEVYYDSRAATKKEFHRRASNLQQYYKENPKLLPQLPFTWHHGVRRFRLGALIVLMWIDACVVPIALYYGLYYGGHVPNWITFAVVTTIWEVPHISSLPSAR